MGCGAVSRSQYGALPVESHLIHVASADPLEPELPTRCISFSLDEQQQARRDAGLGMATERQVKPIALWILGPSAVGKSTLAKNKASDFGIPSKDGAPDAVHVDGQFFRDAHALYQEWTKTEDWKAAYPALKSRINEEKQQMLLDAINHKVHLIIPQTCMDLESCLYEVQRLTDAGYVNNVIAIQAPKEEVARRGRSRAEADGKVYNPMQFDKSVAALQPMIEESNGRFVHLYVSEKPEGPSTGFDVTVTSEGWCGKAIQSTTNP